MFNELVKESPELRDFIASLGYVAFIILMMIPVLWSFFYLGQGMSRFFKKYKITWVIPSNNKNKEKHEDE